MSIYIYSSAHHITWAGRRDSFRQVRAPSGCELVFNMIMTLLNYEVLDLSLRVVVHLVSRTALFLSHLTLLQPSSFPDYFSCSSPTQQQQQLHLSSGHICEPPLRTHTHTALSSLKTKHGPISTLKRCGAIQQTHSPVS